MPPLETVSPSAFKGPSILNQHLVALVGMHMRDFTSVVFLHVGEGGQWVEDGGCNLESMGHGNVLLSELRVKDEKS